MLLLLLFALEPFFLFELGSDCYFFAAGVFSMVLNLVTDERNDVRAWNVGFLGGSLLPSGLSVVPFISSSIT